MRRARLELNKADSRRIALAFRAPDLGLPDPTAPLRRNGIEFAGDDTEIRVTFRGALIARYRPVRDGTGSLLISDEVAPEADAVLEAVFGRMRDVAKRVCSMRRADAEEVKRALAEVTSPYGERLPEWLDANALARIASVAGAIDTPARIRMGSAVYGGYQPFSFELPSALFPENSVHHPTAMVAHHGAVSVKTFRPSAEFLTRMRDVADHLFEAATQKALAGRERPDPVRFTEEEIGAWGEVGEDTIIRAGEITAVINNWEADLFCDGVRVLRMGIMTERGRDGDEAQKLQADDSLTTGQVNQLAWDAKAAVLSTPPFLAKEAEVEQERPEEIASRIITGTDFGYEL